MHWLTASLIVVSTTAGALSTWYWFRSSQIQIMPSWAKNGGFEPVVPELSSSGWIVGLVDGAQKSAALNKLAASYTAIAIASGTIANLTAIWTG